jgi:hypothetical protein
MMMEILAPNYQLCCFLDASLKFFVDELPIALPGLLGAGDGVKANGLP